MQAITRNPLADTSILGVAGGASFAIVTAIFYLGITSPLGFVWFAFAGALVASVLVFIVGASGKDGPTPVKLALAGVVVSALLGSWTSALLLLDEQTIDIVRFWLAGSVAGRRWKSSGSCRPFLILGTAGCILMGHQLNVLSMGDETARALGMNTARTRIICSVLVVVITGAAIAAAGPIGFVGLAVPHMVRWRDRPDYRWILAYSVLVGAIFLTGADILGRVVLETGELQVGIVTALRRRAVPDLPRPPRKVGDVRWSPTTSRLPHRKPGHVVIRNRYFQVRVNYRVLAMCLVALGVLAATGDLGDDPRQLPHPLRRCRQIGRGPRRRRSRTSSSGPCACRASSWHCWSAPCWRWPARSSRGSSATRSSRRTSSASTPAPP